jgi:hypothetical protein
MARAIVIGGGTVGEPTGRGSERAGHAYLPDPRGLMPPILESVALANERMEEIVQTALERGLTGTRLEPGPKAMESSAPSALIIQSRSTAETTGGEQKSADVYGEWHCGSVTDVCPPRGSLPRSVVTCSQKVSIGGLEMTSLEIHVTR